MKAQSQLLEEIIELQLTKFELISNEEFNLKPSPVKWSKKEITGHLIDSAQNNIQRFIRAQYEYTPEIEYNQNMWVELNNYQNYKRDRIIILWELLNRQIIKIWEKLPTNSLTIELIFDKKKETIEWVMNDYLRHLNHHLAKINRSY